ncbi:FMN-binding glutamate synthase family protein [Catenovulum adriaticum]|uniref:FMN-binding glutamate synthase family protein n=1 Tax=Catenovulum adriaticum TaxID=2984846 RepID=A0ABY7AKT3_9ALTE|nr:FMN-binding glutamate synthase family protein [Catenovulum sp. TS8]WAJ69771.1 FMN-binding glutamate synthase family protein [Catenovulum sp. TS8]
MQDSVVFNVNIASSILLALFVIIVFVLTYFYIVDKRQYKHAIRHNYPVIGRLRYFLEKQGEFFRQYFFAMDREEMPFNRAERSWVYRAAKNVDHTIAFGSTRNLDPAGTILFMNCPFPTLDKDALPIEPMMIGPYCETPYQTTSIFNISGMSYGAISKPAVRALANGAQKAGCWLNTGEGGLTPYHLESGADLVVQIGTAKYGVRNEQGLLSEAKLKEAARHPQVKMFEIKMSQGAKPGKGGILPGDKVTPEIADIRGIPVGQDSISPNGHPDIRSVSDLLDMIAVIRKTTGKPVGFKAVIGAYAWIDELCEEVIKRGEESAPDFITIDSADGGTGAAPQPLMDYVGMTLKESIPIVVHSLTKHNLRDRIKIVASGKLVTPSKVAWAIALGADFVTSARGYMFALGCIQSLQCNKNTCPTGIATQNIKRQTGLDVTDKSVRVANYNKFINYGLGILAHSCGVQNIRQLRSKHVRVVTESGLSVSLDKLYQQHE